ncbi:DUF3500 domain-containing protein [Pseudarthrobacter phenanthrenivorans]|uniref:DUF3500 domain-containing protein n=1 Tax=Pseudarthrobacter phenanthrenivorans TaxID=361575 RepID=UPI001129A982|nr:DUF3500 domain-containing protein [Pseudarthrobacter phenanthrenivorans]TPV53501.1 DUF3500 domain-containing protein [Pseudarthrobacter phenanthrenivorans]
MSVDTTADFRRHFYAPDDPRISGLKGLDARGYREAAKADAFTGELIRGWEPLYFQPFRGVTNNGSLREGLYRLQPARTGEEAPVAAMTAAGHEMLAYLSPEQREKLSYSPDAVEWQTWANPEFMQHDTGLRLEEQDERTRQLVLALVEASLSPRGYELVRALMRINGFLGEEVGLPALMNEYSYNIALYGQPSLSEPWGWQLFGHHVALNCLVVGTQMVITPIFFGAEPNGIDHGPFAGTYVFTERIALARRLMETLPAPQRAEAQIYEHMVDPTMPEGRIHPGDERHLAGAFQDNRVIPYEGIRVRDMNEQARRLVDAIIADFTAYLPDGLAAARRREIASHYDETWFSWIGGYGPADPFYYRLQSPVLVLELDHHCGVFLNNKEPAPFHIHTLMRTPNGNDYGRELLRQHQTAYSTGTGT